MKIKKNDQVLIISGDDKGKKGKVLKSFPSERKVLVEGVSLVVKHVRPKKSGQKGQIAKSPRPISVSIVKLVCPKCGKGVRVGFKVQEKGKARICKKCNQEI